jgi:hypothetical protein
MTNILDNVLLLATEHNVTKAYIQKLNSLGMRPSRVIKLEWRNNSYSNCIDGINQHEFSNLARKINKRLKTVKVFAGDLSQSTDAILDAVGWERESFTINHINDEELIGFLSSHVDEKYVIFCGGGILREGILNCSKRFIHVHPGVVPEMRGADCLLWSVLVENRIGMSTFFMNEGIDTGDIIKTDSYEIPQFEISLRRFPAKAVKQLLVNYVDPHYRADTLASLFERMPDPARWETQKQHSYEGKTYYFMHNDLLPQAINRFCKSEMKMVS